MKSPATRKQPKPSRPASSLAHKSLTHSNLQKVGCTYRCTRLLGIRWQSNSYAPAIKKWQGRKPLSVFKSVIYLRNLPPGIRRAALSCRYIWSCRPVLRTRRMLPYGVVGSYPAFSPLPEKKKKNSGGCFLLRPLKITPHCAFHRRVPCPVRTFLSIITAYGRDLPRQIVLPLFWTAKLIVISEKSKGGLNLGVVVPA